MRLNFLSGKVCISSKSRLLTGQWSPVLQSGTYSWEHILETAAGAKFNDERVRFYNFSRVCVFAWGKNV